MAPCLLLLRYKASNKTKFRFRSVQVDACRNNRFYALFAVHGAVFMLFTDINLQQTGLLFHACRNNHFNTLFAFEGAVFLLVTDAGYEREPDIVWERLDSVNGDTTFCTGAAEIRAYLCGSAYGRG